MRVLTGIFHILSKIIHAHTYRCSTQVVYLRLCLRSAIVFTVIIVLAALKFVNETLVFAVVTCVLLFIYMLKLTLFESRKQVFLPARSTRNHALKEPFY